MFAYCNNNPVNGCDPCGTCVHNWKFYDCENCADFWDDVVEWCVDAYNAINDSHIRQLETENEIAVQQVQVIQEAASAAWDAYNDAVQRENNMRYQQALLVNNFVEKQFETPEKAVSTLEGVVLALDVAAGYCGAVAAGWAVPTLGMSVQTAGAAAAGLVLVSLPFRGAAWMIERIAMKE